jgi:hypothetical protein
MAGLVKNRTNEFQRIPEPGGESAAQASSVYQGFYGELPMPATSFVTSTSTLKSLDIVPSVGSATQNAVVKRANNMKGYIASAGFSDRYNPIPQMYLSPYSSKFQPKTIGYLIDYVLNSFLYRAGGVPVGIGRPGRVTPNLSTRVDQLVTRSTGGPGPSFMMPAPRFKKVQTVPRYSTMPQAYNTESAPG